MTRTTRRNRVVGSTAAAAAVLILSACSGTSGGEASARSDTNTGSQDGDAQALVFAACMRENGVDMPDPGPGPQGLGDAFEEIAGDQDQTSLDQAMAACQDRMPQYASEEAHDDEWMLDLAECLREQGLDVSDNPFDEAHRGDIDMDEFSAAMEVCRQELAGGGS